MTDSRRNTPTRRTPAGPRRARVGRRRSAGSILIIVVALLTLVALIGTALIATARVDRYTTRSYVTAAETDAIRSRFMDQVTSQVSSALRTDLSPEYDGPYADPWLADRLPQPLASDSTRPVWRHITGRIVDGPTYANANTFPAVAALPAGPNDFIPPLNPIGAATTTSVADAGNAHIKVTPNAAAATHIAAPTAISLTYPNTASYPVESVRGKTRTFPALEFFDSTGANSLGTYLAGDADGDGIADSVLYRLTASPVNGVTYYAAVRIIDNNSAVNVNTAWSRDDNNPVYPTSGTYTPPTAAVKTFFPSSVGLQEMLSQGDTYTDPITGRKDFVNEMVELMEYRLGYNTDKDATNTDAGGWCDAFKDYSGRSGGDIRAMYAASAFFGGGGDGPVEDPDSDATFGNNNQPTHRTDFNFESQAEALYMQAGRRTGNPGYNMDSNYHPDPSMSPLVPTTSNGSPFPYRAFSASDGANLAYRFLMVNPNGTPNDLELRLRRSAYESAPNYTDKVSAGYIPGTGFSNGTVAQWRSFAANDYRLWFQFLNYDPTGSGPMSADAATRFTPTANIAGTASNPNTANTLAGTGPQQFRSIRPLLTAYNPVSNLIPLADVHSNGIYVWDRTSLANNATLLYPGMIRADMTNKTASQWAGGNTYHFGDMVFDPNTRLTYMRTNDTTTNPNPATDTNHTNWEPQPRVTGKSRINPNHAGFPELWYGFFSLMSSPATSTPDGGTPFDADYLAEVQRVTGSTPASVNQAFYPDSTNAANQPVYDIYRGMKWTEDYGPVFNTNNGTSPATQTDPRFEALGDPTDASGYQTSALRMFRSPIRDPRPVTAQTGANGGLYRFTPIQMTALRSAIAAVNTKQLLSQNNGNPSNTNPVVRTITLYDVDPGNTGTGAGLPDPPSSTPSTNAPVPQYQVTIYGNCVQPYITEIYANNDDFAYTYNDATSGTSRTYQNVGGYIAIELYNPYGVAIPLDGFKILNLPRSATGYTYQGMDLAAAGTVLYTFPAGSPSIPAGGYLVLENVAPNPAGPDYRPPSARFLGSAAPPIPQLGTFLSATAGEMVLLRPRVLADTTSTVDNDVPVDSYDFTGFPSVGSGAGRMTAWHYARAPADWQFVYPGRYDASVPLGEPRQQGTQRTPTGVVNGGVMNHTYTPATGVGGVGGSFDPWMPTDAELQANWPDWYQMVVVDGGWNARVPKNPLVTLSGNNPVSTYESFNNGTAPVPLPNRVSIQLNNTGAPGPNPVAASGNLYPFGGFARNGDLLQVPFIASYTVRRLQASPSGSLVASPAIDPGALVDPTTNVLEMNPVTMDAAFAEDTDPRNNAHSSGAIVASQENVGRFTPLSSGGGITTYDWAGSLFAYFAVNTPSLDYLPDTDPHTYPPGLASATDQPQAVANQTAGQANVLDSGSATTTEDQVPTEGLININTAPAKVLAALPLVPQANGTIDVNATENLARAIVTHRNTGKTFKSFFDLNALPAFANALGTTEPGANQGDLTPGGATDNARYDFEEQYQMMNRISNLITTKSDSYTVYILVQGWREVGTPYPALDWERRSAFIMDRSSGQIRLTPVPTD